MDDFHHSEVETDTMRSIYVTTVQALADVVLRLPGFEHLSTKLKNLDVYKRILAATATDPHGFNVLTHGDLWSNNFMFKQTSPAADDVDGCRHHAIEAIMVDFQTLYIGSPVLDLVYAFSSSSSGELRANDWNELVEHYWRQLMATMTQLGTEARCPSLRQLQTERMKRMHHSISIGLFSLATRNMENVTDADVDLLFGDADENHQQRMRILMEPNIRSTLEYLLLFYDENGYFD